ncbi:18552_t:CDS:2 [Gigaspora margarita]|uniref:18552_t:CDS:1 n=1 Tax=Gigaspora margarita TaxID=4874 RepID=A0ABM8W0J7_GIGMA|nr:18552_t:CDS:2 [Gigaspora margarita]
MKVGGALTFVGSVISVELNHWKFVMPKKLNHNKRKKKRLEIEKTKKIEEKDYRDLNRVKGFLEMFNDIYDRLFWVSKNY